MILLFTEALASLLFIVILSRQRKQIATIRFISKNQSPKACSCNAVDTYYYYYDHIVYY